MTFFRFLCNSSSARLVEQTSLTITEAATIEANRSRVMLLVTNTSVKLKPLFRLILIHLWIVCYARPDGFGRHQ